MHEAKKISMIRVMRYKRNMSQAKLAIKAGINQVSVSRIEMGHEPVYPKRLLKIANALDYDGDPEDLTEFVSEEKVLDILGPYIGNDCILSRTIWSSKRR